MLDFYEGINRIANSEMVIPTDLHIYSHDSSMNLKDRAIQTPKPHFHQSWNAKADTAAPNAMAEWENVQEIKYYLNASCKLSQSNAAGEHTSCKYATQAERTDPCTPTFPHSALFSTVRTPSLLDSYQISYPSEAAILARSMSFASTVESSTDGWLPSPAVITLPLLDTLRGLSLPHAARAVGVSATAFKKACRRLGVRRWDYRRGPGRAGSKRARGASRAAPRSRSGSWSQSRSPDEADVSLVEADLTRTVSLVEADLPDGLDSDGGADDALVLEMLARPWPQGGGAGSPGRPGHTMGGLGPTRS